MEARWRKAPVGEIAVFLFVDWSRAWFLGAEEQSALELWRDLDLGLELAVDALGEEKSLHVDVGEDILEELPDSEDLVNHWRFSHGCRFVM